MNESILIVDDELQILWSLKRLLLGRSYTVFTAKNGKEALDILKSTKINLMITDISMPEMDGHTLLRIVKERYPSVIRIILSGHVDGDILMNLQKNCLAKFYLTKPWRNQEIIRIVEQVFKFENLIKEKKYFELINGIEFLPCIKRTCNRLNALIENECDVAEAAELIENDPATTAKILQITNSALYGFKTGSVKQAIARLGLSNTKNIILSTSLHNGIKGINNLFLQRDLQVLWKHSIMTNHILTYLYQKLLSTKIPQSNATAGLLHDVGKIVLLSKYTDLYIKAMKPIFFCRDKYYYYEEVEFEEITHPEIGGYLLDWWELPSPIVESALYHHSPMDSNVINKELVMLVHMADLYSWNILCSDFSRKAAPEVLAFFNMNAKDNLTLLKEISSMYAR